MHRLFALFLLLFSAAVARADKLVLVAGGGDGADGTEATKAKLIEPFGVDFQAEKIYFVEMVKGERLRAINEQGKLMTVAGTEGVKGHDGDGGDGLKATFNGMHNLAVGPEGVIFLADTMNNRIRTFDPLNGRVAAFAGTGEKGFSR